MTFSVDDLVSSMSSNHIGQEAIDLAALQSQLAATLFCAPSSSSSSSSFRSRTNYACPSPLRTPSTSKSMSMSMIQTTPVVSRRGSCSVVVPSGTPRGASSPYQCPTQPQTSSAFEDAMDEDERMWVEDLLLIPSSPVATAPSHLPSQHHSSAPTLTPASSYFTPTHLQHSQSHAHAHAGVQSQVQVQPHAQSQAHYHTLDQPTSTMGPGSSLFTTTDPFYLAQLQQQQQQGSSIVRSSRFAMAMQAQAQVAW